MEVGIHPNSPPLPPAVKGWGARGMRPWVYIWVRGDVIWNKRPELRSNFANEW
jgi:hypothetical protein